jgi:MYXO-CTERM domain-containing protein
MRRIAFVGRLSAILIVVWARAALADVVVDDFEDVSDWSGLDAEASTVHGGAGAGRWDDHVATTSVSKEFASPVDASGEAFFDFWAHSSVANGALIQIVLDSDNDADPEGWDYFSHELAVDWTGWRHVVIPLGDFGASRHPVGWQRINSVQLSADGWGHTPMADTVLVLDDMGFGTGVIDGVRSTTAWEGADFVATHVVELEERTGAARTLALSIEPAPGYTFEAVVADPTVALSAGGRAEATVRVTVRASVIASTPALDLQRAELVVSEGARAVDGLELEAAVPLPARDHPRTLVDAADLARIASWVGAHAWAASARDRIVASADSWPDAFEEEYALGAWALPPEGGQWTLWYVCPTHGVSLRHEGAGRHVCPVDGEVLTGWPYDQVVYSWQHSDLASYALDLGLAYQLTGDAVYAEGAAEILAAYAAEYEAYPLHDIDGEPTGSAAHVLSQTLDEAIWLVKIAWAYDLVATSGALDAAELEAVEQDLLRSAAETIWRNRAGESNWQSWHDAAVGAVGFALEDPVLIARALRDGANGFEFQMIESVSAEGFWYEGSWSYHFFALEALVDLAEMAQRAGYDAYGNASLRAMFEGPVLFAMPDGSLPAFNDAHALNVRDQDRLYEPAFNRYGDESLALGLSETSRGREALLWGAESIGATPGADETLTSALFPDAGYAVLRAGAGDDEIYLALDFGPHGGWHGHLDKLGFVLFARGAVLGVDPGTQSYAAPTHETWDRVTIAHNTVVVDGASQAESQGQLHRFAALPGISAVTADGGGAYESAALTRTVIVSEGHVIDSFHVESLDGGPHDVDWIYHEVGTPTTALPLAPYAGLPATGDGYQHLTGEAAATTDDVFTVTFAAGPDAPVSYGSVWPSAEGIVASWTYSREQAATGSWSGLIEYDFSAADGYVICSTPPLEAVAEAPSALRLAIAGDGSGNTLALRLYDSTDERFVATVGPVDWTGFRTVEVSDPSTWTHYLGDEDGVFDPPARTIAIDLSHEDTGAAAGRLFVDDIAIEYPTAGERAVEDFEIPERALALTMLGEPSTTVVVGEGLGPDLLEPVPFVMARRRGTDTTFTSVLEPHGEAPRVTSLAPLPSDAPEADGAAAYEVIASDHTERALFVADGAAGVARSFGGTSCDGVLCVVRSDGAGEVSRIGVVEGARVDDDGVLVLESAGPLDALQADLADAGATLAIHAETRIGGELRVRGPLVTGVSVNGEPTPFDRDGDYVVLNLEPTQPDGGPDGDADADADGDSDTDADADADADADSDADGGDDACDCRAAGPGEGRAAGLGLAVLVVAVAMRRRFAGR